MVKLIKRELFLPFLEKRLFLVEYAPAILRGNYLFLSCYFSFCLATGHTTTAGGKCRSTQALKPTVMRASLLYVSALLGGRRATCTYYCSAFGAPALYDCTPQCTPSRCCWLSRKKTVISPSPPSPLILSLICDFVTDLRVLISKTID